MNETAGILAEAYRWQRRLGHSNTVAAHCHIVTNPAFPNVWDANHADAVTARTAAEIDGVFAAMDAALGHTRWRVVHSDGFTPDAFVARLAFEGFQERPVTIQMVLAGDLTARGAAIRLRPVISNKDWRALLQLVVADYAEGRRTGGLDLSARFAAAAVAAWRAKGDGFQFHLVMEDGRAIAYGALAVAPNGAGMIEDLFTLPDRRRRGVATAMIAAFVDQLRGSGCHTIFLGALANEPPRRLYARLGFVPVALARCWVLETTPAQAGRRQGAQRRSARSTQ